MGTRRKRWPSLDRRFKQRENKRRDRSLETCVEKITAGFSNHKEWEGGWVRRGELKTAELLAMFHGTNSAKKQPQMDVNNGLFIRGFVPCNPANYCLQVLNTPVHTHTLNYRKWETSDNLNNLPQNRCPPACTVLGRVWFRPSASTCRKINH